MFNPHLLSEFAQYYGFHYDIVDIETVKRDMYIEMERGLRGSSSTLAMLPAYINPVSTAPIGKKVIALDAGGTNFRAALVRFEENGEAVAEDTQKSFMPGTKGRMSSEQFFDHLAGMTAPLLEKEPNIQGIGFTFSYPMEITKNIDGILLSFSKEIDAPEVIGKAIGQGLREALDRRGVKAPDKIVLLNDTAATLLAGLVQIKDAAYQGRGLHGVETNPVVGFILGTGFNIAYSEKKIPKIGFNSDKAQIVNCEAGGFMPRYLGRLDKEFDVSTKGPGVFWQEKVSAGAYVGPLTVHIWKQAVRDRIITFKKAEEFLTATGLQTRHVNEFMHAPFKREGPIGGLFELDERDALASFVYLASTVTERGAKLSAAVLAAVVEKTAAGFDPFVPVHIAIEGTTYMIYRGLRRSLESYLHTALVSRKPFYYTITPVEQASLFGAAVAALTE
ncbi:MAG: hexokinase [Treponema sp.]|jgi:hexokinase|nr:hexokinase [Treponema sp.]